MSAAADNTVQGTSRRRVRRRVIAGVAALALSLVATGCTLYWNRQIVVEGGATGFYAYIGTAPTSQIQDVYSAGCHSDANCTATVMRKINISAPDYFKRAWMTAWTNSYDVGEAGGALYQIAVNRWVSGGQLNTCLVLVKPTIPFPDLNGGVLAYRWQTRAIGVDGCQYGEFASRGKAARSPISFKRPKSPSDRLKVFCAPLTLDEANPAGSLARRLVSADLAGDRSGATSLSALILALAPPSVAAPAQRLAHAIDLGRAGRGPSALADPSIRRAVGQIDVWAQAHC